MSTKNVAFAPSEQSHNPQDVDDRPSAKVVSAAELLGHLPSVAANLNLRKRWVGEGERVLVRPISRNLVQADLHFRVPIGMGEKKTLVCNGTDCVLCLSQNRPVTHLLVPLYFVEDGDVGVLDFAKAGGPGSLTCQLLPFLGRAEPTLVILDVQRENGRYTVRIAADLSAAGTPNDAGLRFGDDVLRDLQSRGDFAPESLLATQNSWSNQKLLRVVPGLGDRVKLFNPNVDLAKL